MYHYESTELISLFVLKYYILMIMNYIKTRISNSLYNIVNFIGHVGWL